MTDPMTDSMTDSMSGAERRWFGHGRTRALLAAGLLVGSGAVATSAYWTSKATVSGTTLTAGAMHIDLASNNKVKPESYSWTGLNLNGMTAGSTAAAMLNVSNNSTGPVTFSYRVQASATNALGAALKITVRRGGAVSGTTCSTSAGTAVGGADAPLNTFDQPAGADLAQGQSVAFCIQVKLPSGSSVPGGATSAVSFTFPATQVSS